VGREVLHANAWKARDRIAMHRAFREAARADKEIAGLHVKSRGDRDPVDLHAPQLRSTIPKHWGWTARSVEKA